MKTYRLLASSLPGTPVPVLISVLISVLTVGPMGCEQKAAEPAAPAATTDGEQTDGEQTDGEAVAEGDSLDESPTDDPRDDVPEELLAAESALDGDLRTQRAELDNRLLATRTEAAELARAQRELDARLASIGDLERRLDQRLGIGKVARERRQERLTALAALISTMPPQAGAEVVANMSDEDAQHLLLAVSRKSDRRAAKLMALMPPERAAALGQLYLDSDPESVTVDPDAPTPAIPPPAAPPPAPSPPSSAPPAEAKATEANK